MSFKSKLQHNSNNFSPLVNKQNKKKFHNSSK